MVKSNPKFTYPDDARLVECVRACPLLFNHEKFVEIKNNKELKKAWRRVAVDVGRDEYSCKKRWRDIRDHYFKIKRKNLRRGRPAQTKWPLFEMLTFLDNAKRKRSALTYIGPQMTTDAEQDYSDPPQIMTSFAKLEYSDNPQMTTDTELEYSDPPQMTTDAELEYSNPDNSIDIYEPETTVKVEAESSEMEFVGVPPLPPPEEFNFRPATQTNDFHEDLGLRESFERRLSALEARIAEEGEDDVDLFLKSIAQTLKKFPPIVKAQAKLKILTVVNQLEFPR